MTTGEFEVPTDHQQKCTEFKPFKFVGPCLVPHCGRRRKTNPHMRGFWAATLAFLFAFLGWFAFAPLIPIVRKDIGICDNAAEVALDVENAVCNCGKICRGYLGNAQIAAVSLDVFTRFILGSVIERLGPTNTDVLLMAYGSVVVACSTAVTSGTGLIFARFFVSALGSTFVVNQFWNSILFAKSIVGTANATAGGWGNLGGGLTQVLMPLFYSLFHDGFRLSLSASWRLAMIVPSGVCAILAAWIYTCAQDTPTGKFDVALVGKKNAAGFGAYLECLKDYRVLLMSLQYGACFGCELVMNNLLAGYFFDTFKMDLVAAGFLALAFGGMNLFARSLGGILSDVANKRFAMTGRLWIHFLALLGQGLAMLCFSRVTPEQGWGVALAALVIFATCVNAAEGTSYGIVPYMIPQHLAVVSAIVGAGGTLGAVVASATIYKMTSSTSEGMMWHAIVIIIISFTSFGLRWDHLGSMWRVKLDKEEPVAQKPVKVSTPEETKDVEKPANSEATTIDICATSAVEAC